MPITKNKKKEIVASLEDAIKSSSSIVFVNFHGIPVKEASIMRRALRAEKVGYKVAKKTLIKRALGAEAIKGEQPSLDGELALAYGEDSLAPARLIQEFAKKFEGRVKIIGGIFDGRYMDKAEMIEIASIPSVQVLRGMFVNIINSPIQRFVVALNEIRKTKN